MDRIEFFPELPVLVRVEVPVVVNPEWDRPGVRVLPAGATRTVREYKLAGCSVWGTIEEGWIPLMVNGTFSPTDWKMNTPPPVAPKGGTDDGDHSDPGDDSEAYEVKIAIIRMIVRQGPAGNKVGEMVYGRKARVYQEIRFQGQPWLRIGEKKWIPKPARREFRGCGRPAAYGLVVHRTRVDPIDDQLNLRRRELRTALGTSSAFLRKCSQFAARRISRDNDRAVFGAGHDSVIRSQVQTFFSALSAVTAAATTLQQRQYFARKTYRARARKGCG